MHSLVCWLAVLAVAMEAPTVKQVLTFEKDECLKYAGYKEVKDDRLVIRYNAYGTYHSMRTGDATQGEWAIAKTYARPFDPLAKGITESGQAAVRRTGRLLNGFGWMRRRKLTGDWSAYDRLWVDVKSTDAPATIRVTVTDELTVPLPERHYEIPAGAWVTLEFNLGDAADTARLKRVKVGPGEALFFRCRGSALYPARVLDRKTVQAVFLNLVQVGAPSTLLVDNVRLVPAGLKAKPALPPVVDNSPWPRPEALPAATKPVPIKRSAQPAAAQPTPAPVLIDLINVRMVSYGRLHNDRCGIAVADADRMAITVEAGMNRCVFVTNDGGRTWTGLDGTPAPTPLFRGNLMMVGATSTVASDGPDLLLVTLKHCAGGEESSWVHFQKVAFVPNPPLPPGERAGVRGGIAPMEALTQPSPSKGEGSAGARWQPGPIRVMDTNSWHCSEHTMDVLRLPNGRLWAAWTPTSRTQGLATTARYSDDDGATWRDLGENGVLGGRGRPLLLPYGDGVACFRTVGWREHTVWSHTTGGRWTAPKRINVGKGIVTGITLGERTMFVAVSRPGKLLRLDGEQWVEEAVPFAPRRLSTAGNRVVALGLKDRRTILMSVRGSDGTWESARELVTENVDIMDLAVPRHVEGAAVPIIWAPRNHKWVKFLRVPL